MNWIVITFLDGQQEWIQGHLRDSVLSGATVGHVSELYVPYVIIERDHQEIVRYPAMHVRKIESEWRDDGHAEER